MKRFFITNLNRVMSRQSTFSFGKIKNIQSVDSKPENICWEAKFDYRKIDLATQIIVQEGEIALLLLNQNITAILENGTYPLAWVFNTVPDDNFASLKVIFFTRKNFTDQRWGTPTPIIIQDADTGTLSLRAHGTFAYQLDNPKKLWRHIPLDSAFYTAEDIIGELRSAILDKFAATLNKETQLPKLLQEREQLAQRIMDSLSLFFKDFGLKLSSFLIQSISLPEDQMATLEKFRKLEKLNDLLRQGVLTQEEYDAKKRDILKDI